jgi:hypothetical protein
MAHDKVDWSQAPRDCVAWIMTENKGAYWLIVIPRPIGEKEYWMTEWISAPNFCYTHNWFDSITLRPQE